MVVCQIHQVSFHGNEKYGCPKCHEEKLQTAAELQEKEEKIAELNTSILEKDSQSKSMTDLATAMAAMATTMQSFMLEMKETRKERRQEEKAASCRHCVAEGGKASEAARGSVDDTRSRRQPRMDLDDLWRDRDGDYEVSEFLHRVEKKRSKYDILRFLPEGERKKVNPIDSMEKLTVLLSRLMDDLEDRGESIKTLRAHHIYVATMASQGIYDIKALVAYDAAVREKAEKAEQDGGQADFGVDTTLSNFHLGYAGTKHARTIVSQSQNINKNVGNPGGRYGGGKKSPKRESFTGWKKLSAERGCCFTFGSGRSCEGCNFRHQCAHCGSTSHGMLACKQAENPTTNSG